MNHCRDRPLVLRIALAALLALVAGCGSPRGMAESADRPDQAPAPLECTRADAGTDLDVSLAPRQLACAAVAHAASSEPARLQALQQKLLEQSFLTRIDGADAYLGTYDRLRLGPILDTLARNPAPVARAAMASLAGSKVFLDHPLRVQLYIRAFRHGQRIPIEVLTLFEALAAPASPVAFDVIDTLAQNQSPAAMALLEAKLLADDVPRPVKQGWLRESLIAHRYDGPLLDLALRVLEQPADSAVKLDLIEILFDYQPERWYVVEQPTPPPGIGQLSDAGEKKLRRIGAVALDTLPLTNVFRTRVQAALRDLR